MKKAYGKIFGCVQSIACFCVGLTLSKATFADLPRPKDSLIPSGNESIFDTMIKEVYSMIDSSYTLAGSVLVLAGIAGIFWSWKEARRQEDLSILFKHGLVAAGIMVVGLFLAFYGQSIVSE